jgi:hypothetical protein
MRWLALVVLVGCGGGLDFDDYAAAADDARCTYLVRCGLFPDQAACRAYLERRRLEPRSLAAAIDAGKTRYDGEAAEACLAALASASCSAAHEPGEPDVCDAIFTGTGGDGAACAFDAECASNRCVVPACGMACCLGTCGPPRTPAAIGQSCASTACEAGTFCNVDQQCQALLGPGAACDDSSQCAYGLGCAGTLLDAIGTCKVLPALGQPCPELVCGDIGAVCSAGGTCVAAGLPGDPCASAADCSFYYTCDGAQCVAYPTRGQSCTSLCSDDSWCDRPSTEPGTCAAPKPDGSACQLSSECQSRYCDRSGTTGTCIVPPLCF